MYNDPMFGLVQENLKSPSAHVRGTAVTALKYTISDQPQPIDSLLHECIADFLSTIGDPDLVRKGLTFMCIKLPYIMCGHSVLVHKIV